MSLLHISYNFQPFKLWVYFALYIDILWVCFICYVRICSMKRLDEEIILEWFKREIHKPLVVRGARQVGKSTLVRRKNEKQHLFYWLREGRSSNAKVDFLIQKNSKIIPIEVKAGKTGTLKSIHQFIFQKGSDVAIRFDLNPPRLESVEVKIKQDKDFKKVRFKLLSLPLYMIEILPRLLSSLLT